MNKKLITAGMNYYFSLCKKAPTFANIFYTRRCNLKCDFCNVYQKVSNKELTLEEWKECSDSLYDLGNRYISIVGGEPLLRKDVTKFIKHISKKNIITSLVTNAILLDEKKINELIDAGLLNIGISTQSLIPNKKEKGQNKELFNLLLKYKKDIEITALTTITNKNYREVPEIARFIIKKGFRFAPNIVASGENFWFRNFCPELQFHTKEEQEGLKKTINKLIEIKKQTNKITYSEYYLKSLHKYAINPNFKWNCKAGKDYIAINEDGCVMFCQDLKPTNIFYKDLKKHYPLKQKLCKNCVWPCYYDESYKKSHKLKFLKDAICAV